MGGFNGTRTCPKCGERMIKCGLPDKEYACPYCDCPYCEKLFREIRGGSYGYLP